MSHGRKKPSVCVWVWACLLPRSTLPSTLPQSQAGPFLRLPLGKSGGKWKGLVWVPSMSPFNIITYNRVSWNEIQWYSNHIKGSSPNRTMRARLFSPWSSRIDERSRTRARESEPQSAC